MESTEREIYYFYKKPVGKTEKSQVNNLSCHPKKLEKVKQIKTKSSRRKAWINIRVEINELEKKTEKINETKSSFSDQEQGKDVHSHHF